MNASNPSTNGAATGLQQQVARLEQDSHASNPITNGAAAGLQQQVARLEPVEDSHASNPITNGAATGLQQQVARLEQDSHTSNPSTNGAATGLQQQVARLDQYSNTILAKWERQHGYVTDKKHKVPTLQDAMRKCGLSTSNKNRRTMKIYLMSLRKVKLPRCRTQVLQLVDKYQVDITGLRSPQQKAERLLETLDPSLRESLGQSQSQKIVTGVYEWQDEKMHDLLKSIDEMVVKWVTIEPPFLYNSKKPEDVRAWQRRRKQGMDWVQSPVAHVLAKQIYRQHVDMFTAAINAPGRKTIHQRLQLYCHQRNARERGEIRQQLAASLNHLREVGHNVVDLYSFLTINFTNSVFEYFKTQVRAVPANFAHGKRKKDREDEAKTYYIAGVILRYVKNKLMRLKDADGWLRIFAQLHIDSISAQKAGLPTRHVTLKTGGGLLFVSSAFYDVISKMEEHFFCTVSMRTNFAVPQTDAISKIRAQLLNSQSLKTLFNKCVPSLHDVDYLWGMVVQRLSTLHGNEMAARMMEELASLKRIKKSRNKSKVARPLQLKFEQLRAAKKRKKIDRIERKLEVFDEQPQIAQLTLGEKVTALEGTASATKLYDGIVVEIDLDSCVYVICCKDPAYPNGYNMIVPFKDMSFRINVPVHSQHRKRKKKQIFDNSE